MGKATKEAEADIFSMSDDDLMDAWTALGDEVAAGQARLREFSQEHQRRTRKEQLARTVGSASAQDMELLQEIAAEGVDTEEQVNG